MGILNAIFAPFIVLYLLMYSFFRYFEVWPIHWFYLLYLSVCRNIARTPHRSAEDNTRLSHSGNFENLTNCRMYLPGDLTKVIQPQACTLDNSPMRK
jgi:hypothetical protein